VPFMSGYILLWADLSINLKSISAILSVGSLSWPLMETS